MSPIPIGSQGCRTIGSGLTGFSFPKSLCWSKDNAAAVLRRYLELQSKTGKKPSCNALAKEFGKSRPTILQALDYAQCDHDEPTTKHRRASTVKIKGNVEVERRIEEMHDAGVLEKDIASEIGTSRSSITAALKRLYGS